jgi:thymidylate synthase ThyX
MIKSNFFMPIGFQKVHSGMQGNEYFQGEELIECQKLWQNAIETNIKISAEMTAFGITKQLANRWLEPAQYIEVILTGTDFDNFFNLRLHKDAEIHIYKIAEIMKSEMALSTPKKLKKGEWHIPNVGFENEPLSDKIKMTTAKLARTSFKTLGDDYKFTKNQDINLHDRLIKEGHFSPLEHCAENQDDNQRYFNFKGFKQYRQFVMNNELDKIK